MAANWKLTPSQAQDRRRKERQQNAITSLMLTSSLGHEDCRRLLYPTEAIERVAADLLEYVKWYGIDWKDTDRTRPYLVCPYKPIPGKSQPA